jgi:beta-lactamase class A
VVFIVAAFGGAACMSRGETTAHGNESPGGAQGPNPTPVATTTRPEIGVSINAELSARLKAICERAGGDCGVVVIHVEAGRASESDGAKPLPLYSVFKLPLAVAVLKDVEEGRLSLEQKVRVTPADVSPGAKTNNDLWSKAVERSVRELLELSLVRSDNTSSDQLLKLVGGPAVVTQRMHALGLEGIVVRSSVRQFALEGGEPNTGTATDLARLLGLLQKGEALQPAQLALLLDLMTHATTGERRLRAGVPAGTPVADKTGTGPTGTSTNDVGLITLPGGEHLALAVLLSGSKLGDAEQEKLIAELARAAYDAYAARLKQ